MTSKKESGQKDLTLTLDLGFLEKELTLTTKKNGSWNYVAPRQNPTIEGFFTDGEPSGEWKVIYNKKTYKGSLNDLKKQIPKLNEFSF